MSEEPFYTAEEILKKWSVEELDRLHNWIGIGYWWQISDRRKELKGYEDREIESLKMITEILDKGKPEDIDINIDTIYVNDMPFHLYPRKEE